MIKVGVFWISALLTIDIIYDIEIYSTDIDYKEILITLYQKIANISNRIILY